MKFFDTLKDIWLSIALPAVHAESSAPKNSSSKTSHHPSGKQGHDSQSADPKHGSHHHTHEYRECGDTHSVPLDKHLPDINLEDLEPMKSVVPECQNLKLEYDDCFNHWFARDFLNGSTNMKPCMELFKKYTSCVKKGLQDQNIELYPHLSLIPPDPEIHKIDKPRTKPPPGAKLHKESDHHRDPYQHGSRN